MNFSESQAIINKLENSQKILVNCHRSPDGDSIGSALSFYKVLYDLGKTVEVVCCDDVDNVYKFLPLINVIKKVNFQDFNFEEFDTFLILDSSDWKQALGLANISIPPSLYKIVIDHHVTNKRFGDINLIAETVASTTQILYRLFEDWRINIEGDLANLLLAGIITDTGVFRYPMVTGETFFIVEKLLERGADKERIILEIYKSLSPNTLRLWGKMLENIQIENKHNFVWCAIPYEVYLKFDKPAGIKSSASEMFFNSVWGTDFGMVMVEEEKGKLMISLRSRTKFDVSKIATDLGGGGHKAAAGVTINAHFEDAIDKVLAAARKYSNSA